MNIELSTRFKEVAMCPNYPILGFRFMATSNKVNVDSRGNPYSIDEWGSLWLHGTTKMASAVSSYANSYIDDNDNLIITLQNKENTIALDGSDVIFIYKDLVTNEYDMMGIIRNPNIGDNNPLEWMVATSEDNYDYVNYLFNFGDLFKGIKCDLILECKDESIGHVFGSDVDKHVLNYKNTRSDFFIMRNSAEYVINSNKSSRVRLKNSFMINPSGLMNYGEN